MWRLWPQTYESTLRVTLMNTAPSRLLAIGLGELDPPCMSPLMEPSPAPENGFGGGDAAEGFEPARQ